MDNIIELTSIQGWSSEPRMVGVCKRHSSIPGLKGKTMLSTTITKIAFFDEFAVVDTANKVTFKVIGNLEPLRRLNALLKCLHMEQRHESRQQVLCF